MRSCARGCLVQLTLWAAFSAAFFLYLRNVSDAPTAVAVLSVLAGLLTAMAAILVKGVVNAARERRMLVRPPGQLPPDGSWVAVSGALRTRTPVRGPISGEPLVAYEYRIQRWDKSGRNSMLNVYYDGKALSGAAIDTPFGAVRVLSVPDFEIEPAHVESGQALANARAYIRATTFEKRDTASERSAAMEREWTDDDGVFRIDRKNVVEEPDLTDGFQFEERQIRQGEEVTAFGVYSQERGGLIHDPRFGRTMRIRTASAAEAALSLRGRMVRYTIGACILAALVAAIVIAIPGGAPQ